MGLDHWNQDTCVDLQDAKHLESPDCSDVCKCPILSLGEPRGVHEGLLYHTCVSIEVLGINLI